MSKRLMKPFAFIFSFLLIFANLSFVQPSETFAKTLDNAVTISVLDADGGDIVGMQAVEFEDGDTALDVLEEVADVEAKDTDYGPMIEGINGVNPDWEDNGSYWHIAINGQSAQVGAHDIILNHADNILFFNKNNDHEDVTIDVTVDGETEIVELDTFSTAYDGLKQAAKQLEIPFEVTLDAQWFAFITKLTDRELNENEFWSFMINEQFAEVGVSDYRVSEADSLSFEVDSFESEEDENEDDVDKNTESNGNQDEEPSNNTEDNDKQDNEENKTSNNEQDTDENEEKEQAHPKISVINKQVTDDLKDLKKEIKKRGLLSEHGHEAYVWAYAKAGGKVPAEYRDNIAKALKEDDTITTSTNELAKVIIALSVAGFDATDVGDVNLVDTLMNDEGIFTGTSVATPTYVLHAFDSGDYDINESIKNELLNSILDQQMPSGGWGFFGDTPSPDITGMVLNTLAPYKSDETVAKSARKAIDYLANGFDGTGWYHDQWSGGYTSEALSQVIVGLSAYGTNPTEAPFIDEEGKSLLAYLLEFKAEDGLYKHVVTGDSDIGFATSQAFLALAYYKDAFIQETEAPEQEEEKEEPKKETPSNDDKDKNDGGKNDNENNAKLEKDETTITTDDSDLKVTENTIKAEEVKDETLPQTNSNVFNILAIGLLLIATGIVLVVLRKKWQSA